MREPIISVGLKETIDRAVFEINGEYMLNEKPVSPGRYECRPAADDVVLINDQGHTVAQSKRLHLCAESVRTCSFCIEDVTIGKDFHWQRLQTQQFSGDLILTTSDTTTIQVVNEIPLEMYLEAVICSEMNPEAPFEFLKAHCVCSRSWLLAQLRRKSSKHGYRNASEPALWTDAAAHTHFDVCADDHCQRYHGRGSINEAAQKALIETKGEVLVFEDVICDTRFSKCCGGITEKFSTAWQNHDVPYLAPVADCQDDTPEFDPPVSTEKNAQRFIGSSPDVYCNVTDKDLLRVILPDFDYETRDFFRWQVNLTQEELARMLLQKTGVDFGIILDVVPISRGASGRISQLKIAGHKQEKIFGKELEVRRILSPTHLYSSAFFVEPYGGPGTAPKGFLLRGAGWGHGVGLCQIGAAAMAIRGRTYKQILSHYFRGASLKILSY